MGCAMQIFELGFGFLEVENPYKVLLHDVV